MDDLPVMPSLGPVWDIGLLVGGIAVGALTALLHGKKKEKRHKSTSKGD